MTDIYILYIVILDCILYMLYGPMRMVYLMLFFADIQCRLR